MHRKQGITLIELMVTLSVLVIVLLLAMPPFSEFLAKRRLEGASTELGTDLQYARSLAVDHRTDVSLTTRDNGQGYDIVGNVIENGILLQKTFKTASLSGGAAVSGGVMVSFEAHRGMRGTTGSDPSVTVTSPGTAATLTISVNQTGRVQVCSPGGIMKAYPACPP